MSPKRLFLAVTLSTLAVLPARPAMAQLDFGTTELGEIRGSCFRVCFGTDCTQAGTINSINVAPPFFVRGIRRGPNGSDLCNNPAATDPASLPVNLQAGQALIFDVDLVASDIGFFSQPIEINGSPTIDVSTMVNPAGPCPASATDVLCLQDERFAVRTRWRTQIGNRDHAPIVQGVNSDDSGLFYFFSDNNWEILLKVLDGCPINSRFWVFYAATTNVEFTVTVTDTQEQQVKTYFNPLDMPAEPIQDTNAFATCP